ncbi:MAG: Rap1a/Tai family immunity protein [Gammaproteobacteria bacterium]
MINSKFFIYVVLMFILSESLAIADPLSVDSLLNSIKDNDHENIQSIDKFFAGYISGVAEATIDNIWCPPQNIKGRQLQNIITKYYKSFPKESDALSGSAKDLILEALTDAYPCKK